MEEQAMYTNNDKPKLNDEKVTSQARKTLEIFLPLEADGYCVTTDTLYDILIGIADNRGTTEAVSAELASAPDPETIRCYFREQFRVEQLQDLQRSINDGLVNFRCSSRSFSASNRPPNATHWVKRPLKGFQQNQKADAHRRAVS
jgi:hypothetical protein